MEAAGAKDGDTQVCAFMGISASEQEMSQLNLDGKVCNWKLHVVPGQLLADITLAALCMHRAYIR